VAAGSQEGLWLSLLQHVVLPAARAFHPQLVLVSAGFDAHFEDPLANCRLQTRSFAAMAALVREFADGAGVPLGVVLEGGYNHAVLAECVCATLPALAGELPAPARPPAPVQPDSPVERAIAQVGRYWPL
jgi:acetoin utilization deacetylase AcuC-like enzyme